MNILIVDANVGTLALLKQVVSSGFPNCAVFVATTGREAVQQVASGAVDAVVLDINLPDARVGEVLRQIKSHKPDVPVVALALDANPAYTNAYRKAGVSGYLTKGAAPYDLVRAIQLVLQGGTFFPTE